MTVSFSAGYFRDLTLSQENPLLCVRVDVCRQRYRHNSPAVCKTITDRKNTTEQTRFCLSRQIYRKLRE